MNQPLSDLLNKAKQSLSAARLLYSQEYYDFAASRAYYAMFYVAEAMLLTKDLAYSSHAGVIGSFGREFAKPGLVDAKYHRYLLDAEDRRNVGDYGIGSSLSIPQVEQSLTWAEEFIQMGRQFLSSGTTDV
jgi:uncharacterized protein (UPF0332 family)